MRKGLKPNTPLNPVIVNVLITLAEKKVCTADEISVLHQRYKPNINRDLTALRKRGLATRERIGNHGYQHRITPAGRLLARQMRRENV